jgi:hypothetical protein
MAGSRTRHPCRAVALAGFGFDSWIEAAATVVLIRAPRRDPPLPGGHVDHVKQHSALRFVAITFLVLATYVTIEGIRDLIDGATPNTSIVGIVLTGLSIMVIPWLAAGQEGGEAMNSRPVLADAPPRPRSTPGRPRPLRRTTRLRPARLNLDRPDRRIRHRRLRHQGRPRSLERELTCDN